MKKDFKYSNFWLRSLIKVPLIFIIAFIEYNLYGYKINEVLFYITSALIMVIVVIIINKLDSKIFIKNGKFEIDDNNIKFLFKYNKLIIDKSCITNVEFTNVSVWNINMSKIVLSYKFNSKEKVKQIFSKDLINKSRDEELWDLYLSLKDLIK